nr:LOW QUALITY PROTEIN: uncharacterized protein LOC128706291 [Cherax quadricarinatus]
MLDADHVDVPELSQVTVCVRYRLLHAGENNSPILSYFAKDSDNELQVGKIKLSPICAPSQGTCTRVMYRWHHSAIALYLIDRKYWLSLRWRRKKCSRWRGQEKLSVAGGGRLVLAQDLDTLAGGFDIRQSIHGDVRHLFLFSQALPLDSLRPYIKCQQPMTSLKPLIYFDKNMTLFKAIGSVEIFEAPLGSLCKQNSSSLVMFLEKLDFQSSFSICSIMKGSMAVPKSDEENTEIFNEFVRFNDICVDDYGTLYWLGFKGDLQSGEWLTLTNNQTLSWNKLFKGYDKVKLGQMCASVGGASFPYNWYSTPCQIIMCPLCNFTSTPTFKVRGLCKDSLIDKTLFIWDYKNDRVQFRGPHYTTIYWDTDNSTWKLTSRSHKKLLSYMVMKTSSEYPLGVHTWTLMGDKCLINEVEMLITVCSEGEFTCSDGNCIKKSQRCDLTSDCLDKSDEINCNFLQIPSGYSVDMPPPKEQNAAVPVYIFVEITSVRRLDIMSFKIALDVILSLFWRDGRLTMRNLREDFNLNKVQDHKNVWMPRLQMEDGSRSLADLLLRSELLMVQRDGRPAIDDDVRLFEDDVYLGSENTLVLRQVFTVDFTCQFLLQRYPFDSQMCSVAFSLVNVAPSVAVLLKHEDGVSFTGLRRLLEYEVTNFNMTQLQNPLMSSQRMFLELKNLVGYYISSVYIPTLLLLIICYLTLFFDINDFSDRVMVSLTSLLVLAALFSQTSQAIPKTAYLKLIDVWFVFLIVVEFTVVLILVITENLRYRIGKVPPKNVKVISGHTSFGQNFMTLPVAVDSKDVHQCAIMMNKVAQVTLPVLVILFIVGYFIVCFVFF